MLFERAKWCQRVRSAGFETTNAWSGQTSCGAWASHWPGEAWAVTIAELLGRAQAEESVRANAVARKAPAYGKTLGSRTRILRVDAVTTAATFRCPIRMARESG